MDTHTLLKGYNLKKLSVGALGGHSALDVAYGATSFGLKSVVVAQKGREKTYDKYYRKGEHDLGCIDEVLVVNKFQNVLDEEVQQKLRKMNTIFVHNRYFWVYFDDVSNVENDFRVPIFGSRHLLRLEERDGSARLTTGQKFNQYDLLKNAGIRSPKIFKSAQDIDRPVLVKASEAKREYERGFFLIDNASDWESKGSQLERDGKIGGNWRKATIEEFVVGAAVNFNFFYSPLTKRLELLGTDTRRQTNLDGFLHMMAEDQTKARQHIPLKMIETGHIAVTVKESILEKAFDLGEKFVKATQSLSKKIDPSGKGIVGPFALQGAVVAEDGKEDIVIFDVSLRIPGSPGIAATPYSAYLHGRSLTMGERIAMEIQDAAKQGRLEEVVT